MRHSRCLSSYFYPGPFESSREYERGVIFTLGRFTGVKGPGLIILIPIVQQLVKVDLRVMERVSAAVQDDFAGQRVRQGQRLLCTFSRIVDPERAIKVGDYMAATSQARPIGFQVVPGGLDHRPGRSCLEGDRPTDQELVDGIGRDRELLPLAVLDHDPSARWRR